MKVLPLSLALAVVASAANAQMVGESANVLFEAVLATPVTTTQSTQPAPDFIRARAPARYASPLPAGIARTAIDRRFGDDDAVGSFGYLCGLNPGQKMSGAAGAAGYDPMGKFLGTKLSFAFR